MFLKEKLKVPTKSMQNGKKLSSLCLSMRVRLFAFLVIIVVTMVFGILAVLLITGVISSGMDENIKIISTQMGDLSNQIERDYGDISHQVVELSLGLTQGIEKNLSEKDLEISDLKNSPELLEEIINTEYERTLFALQKAKSSGAFFILNETVNPDLNYSENSKAGLYIKNMEPNVLSSSSPTILIFRGPPSIGRNNSISLHSQWAMEFDVSNADYFYTHINNKNDKNYSLSRLYYWSSAVVLPNTNEEVMLCTAPLIDSSGNVYGVCGFEISTMLFKLAYPPDNSKFNNIFSSYRL